jgi:hypothetical protein
VLDAFRWFAAKAGHGHIVMLGAYGGGEDGQHFYRDVGGVKSVETLVFNSARPRRTRRSSQFSRVPTASSSKAATNPNMSASGRGRRSQG